MDKAVWIRMVLIIFSFVDDLLDIEHCRWYYTNN